MEHITTSTGDGSVFSKPLAEMTTTSDLPLRGPEDKESEALRPNTLEEEPSGNNEAGNYLTGFKLYGIVLGLSLAIFLMALDSAVLATAIPTITTAFNSLNDVGWYGSAFLFTSCAFQPLAGKIFQYFSLKWAFLTFVSIFEIGSLVCATAPSSVVLIIGRAIAGIGAAGVFPGGLIIVAHIAPRNMRPMYTGILTSTFGLSSAVGPVIGGAFTQHVSWRWCFYINLPLGAVTVATIFLLYHPKPLEPTKIPFGEKVKHLDLLGFALFTPAVIMLLLAFQWAGNLHAWKSATIIGLICGSAAVLGIFFTWQSHKQDEAIIPPRVFLQRTIFWGASATFFGMGAPLTVAYYLPIWFQVIKGVDPTLSGVMYLPTVLANVLISIIGGITVTKLGYFNPGFLVGLAFSAIGSGLLSTLHVNSDSGFWIGYQIICGFGFGLIVQMALISAQAALPLPDIPTGTTIIVFFQFLSGSIWLATAQSIFQSRLLAEIAIKAPAEDARAILDAGAKSVRQIVSPGDLKQVLLAYNVAITNTFFTPAATCTLAFFLALGMKWISIKGKQLG